MCLSIVYELALIFLLFQVSVSFEVYFETVIITAQSFWVFCCFLLLHGKENQNNNLEQLLNKLIVMKYHIIMRKTFRNNFHVKLKNPKENENLFE